MKASNLNEEQIYDDTYCLFWFPLSRKKNEDLIVLERIYLCNKAFPCGAHALKRHLHNLYETPVPFVGTIGRILVKHCLHHVRTGYYSGYYQ